MGKRREIPPNTTVEAKIDTLIQGEIYANIV